jgi:hypothetical protein
MVNSEVLAIYLIFTFCNFVWLIGSGWKLCPISIPTPNSAISPPAIAFVDIGLWAITGVDALSIFMLFLFCYSATGDLDLFLSEHILKTHQHLHCYLT